MIKAKFKLDVAKHVDYYAEDETYMVCLPYGWRFDDDIVHTRGYDTLKELKADVKTSVIPCTCVECKFHL